MSDQVEKAMEEIRRLSERVLALEHRVQGHADSILVLHKRTDDNTAILNKIQSTLTKLLYIAVGLCLYHAASTIGFFDALKLAVL